MLNWLLPMIGGALLGGLQGGGERGVGFAKLPTATKEQQKLANQLYQVLSGWMPQPELRGTRRATLANLMDLSPEKVEEYYQTVVRQPALKVFEEETLPAIRRSYIGPGTFWSSMRAEAERKSRENLEKALEATRLQEYERRRQLALSALPLALQEETYPVGAAMQYLNIPMFAYYQRAAQVSPLAQALGLLSQIALGQWIGSQSGTLPATTGGNVTTTALEATNRKLGF